MTDKRIETVKNSPKKTFYNSDTYTVEEKLDIPPEGLDVEALFDAFKFRKPGKLFKITESVVISDTPEVRVIRESVSYQFKYGKNLRTFKTFPSMGPQIWHNGQQLSTKKIYKIVNEQHLPCHLIDDIWYFNGDPVTNLVHMNKPGN